MSPLSIDIASHANPTHFSVSPNQQDQAQVSSSGGKYDFVKPVPKPRRSSRPKQAVYEIPPGAVAGSVERDPEGVYGLVGTPVTEVSKPLPRKKLSPQFSESMATQSYDMVSFPPRDMSTDTSLYDNVPPPRQSRSQSEMGSSFGSDIYGDVANLDRQGEGVIKPCPLEGPGYDFVQLRQPLTQTEEAGQETLPYAQLPGYEPMGPPENARDFEYEVLAPCTDHQPNSLGQYETPTVVSPRREPKPTSSSPPSVYEIAPPPRSVPEVPQYPPPAGTRFPAPTAAPPPPPREVQGICEVSWFQKPQTADTPVAPKRVMNDYQDVTVLKKLEGRRNGAYEEVRVEFPQEGIDWKKIRQAHPNQSAGEYCTLSPIATVPTPTSSNRLSTTSSDTSTSASDVPLTPPFSPPSPRTAQASVFEAFHPSALGFPTIPEAPEERMDTFAGLSKKPPPPLTKRKDSLQDENFALSVVELGEFPVGCLLPSHAQQDPFSYPPVLSDSAATTTTSVMRNDFASLHKRYSPHSSREDLTSEVNGDGREQEQSGGAESTRLSSKPSVLLYENVLFSRSDSLSRTKSPGAQPEVTKRENPDIKERPESYRLSAVAPNSPLDESAEWEKVGSG